MKRDERRQKRGQKVTTKDASKIMVKFENVMLEHVKIEDFK